MIEYKQLKNSDDIYDALMFFDVCFPHLKEKISDMQQFACKLSEFAEVYVSLENDKHIGISCFYCNDTANKIGYITLIGVLPEYQGVGLGKSLLDFTVSVMKKKNMQKVKLEVDNDNSTAKKFYYRQGFIEDSVKETSSYLIREI